MLTEFGKSIRKIRLDKGILLKEMAESLGITPSYLSSIEHGKRKVPKGLIESLVKNFNLSREQEDELIESARKSALSIKIELSGRDAKTMEFANAFARKFDNLSDNQVEEIMKVLKEDK